jgi:hypothetical protein
MYKLLLLIFLCNAFQQGTKTISPDGKFRLTIEANEESDLRTRYILKLTNITSKETLEITNCIRRDLPAPNYYWNKESEFLIFEWCDESFKDSKIKILNLKTKQIDFELIGLIGNKDDDGQQFDAQNDILLYFEASDTKSKITALWSFNLKTKEKKKLFDFKTSFDMEFPEINHMSGNREVTVRYSDMNAEQKIQKIRY